MDLFAGVRRAGVTAQRIAQVTLLRLNGVLPPGKTPELEVADIRSFTAGLGANGMLRAHDLVELAPDRPPWHDTGIDLVEGESVTWLAGGRVYLSGLLDIFVGPNFQLWARIGDGPVFSGTRATHSFRADRSGRLKLASYFPGEWAEPSGSLATPVEAYKGITGGLAVAILRWDGNALDGLRSLQATKRHPLVDLEIDRLTNVVPPPDGWKHLWFLGSSEIYSSRQAGAEIHCETCCDVGILQRDVDLPFEPGTRLLWSWKVDSLPSALAEDTLPTHDYLSIAVEFSNGIDITYYWSAGLAPGTGYWCPLPTWAKREYHVAARTGTAELGRWIDEDKDLHADYAAHIGKPPERITRVWLISNSLFQRGRGECTYRTIRLRGGDGE
ncbi:MAG: DUF3047 domain-containing protein, partial [Candidatus Binatia bacterium]